MDAVRVAGLVLNKTASVMPVNQDGMALAVTSAVLKVTTVIVARTYAHNAETKNHVTQKLENAYPVTLVGLDQGTDLPNDWESPLLYPL